MSTTKFMTATGSNRELHIKRSNEDHVQIRQFDPEFHTHQAKTFFLDPSEAPVLCLAILEAAGVTETDSPYMQEAADNLRAYILIEEKVTAEARERAELEAEALELFNVVREHDGEPRVATWGGFHAGTMEVYLLLARRAREMRAEK